MPPRRARNDARRPREHLFEHEIDKLIAAARRRQSRYPSRDATMILLAFRHGLRGDEPLPLCVAQASLGHRDIRHTERYTTLSPDAFRDVWKRRG